MTDDNELHGIVGDIAYSDTEVWYWTVLPSRD
jgi:hypothetical protein